MSDKRRKPGPPSSEDLALWQSATREATPIRRRAVAPKSAPTAAKPVKAVTAEAAPDVGPARKRVAAKGPAPVVPKPMKPEPRPLERGAAPGVDKRQAERLKRGRTAIEARIDLHGLTLESAHRRLVAFLERAQDDGKRAVLVVTGKGLREGTGVIRAQAPRWLNEPRLRPLILTYEYAQPKDGGMGALYILLRKKR